jgi:hypothetical protein
LLRIATKPEFLTALFQKTDNGTLINMALQLRRKTHESVIHIDRDSAPRIVASGMDFILEDLPVGTRVIYPNEPLKGLPNREAAIRYALNHPARLRPAFRATQTRHERHDCR